MNSLRSSLAWLRLLGLLAFSASAQSPAPTPPPPAPNTRFAVTRSHIDSLYRYRNKPLPPPDANPFRLLNETPSAGVVASTSVAPPPDSDDTILRENVATLKIGGYFVLGGKAVLTINRRPYREGDTVIAGTAGTRVYLRIRQITPNSVTLALNQAEMTVKF
jgi:hypothetical protein